MNKLKYLMILALALALGPGVWAQGHQRYTTAVNLSVLQVGDTLAEGASITFDIGNPNWGAMQLNKDRAKKNGTPVTDTWGASINLGCTIGAGGVIINGSDSFTPVTESGADGDAWVVTYLNVNIGEEVNDIDISGVLLPVPAPTVEVTRTSDNNWTFTMPDYNLLLKVTYFEQPGLTWFYGTDTMPNAGLTVTRGFHADAIQNIRLQVSDTFNTAMRGHFELDQVSAPSPWASITSNFLPTDITNFVDNSSLTEEQVLTFPNPDPGTNQVYLIYGFDGYAVKYVLFNGTNVTTASNGLTKSNIYYLIDEGAKIFYTTTTVVQGLTLRYGSSNPAVVSFSNPNNMSSFSLNGTGEADIYAVFDGDTTFQYDSVAFHVTVNDPATLTLAQNGNGTVEAETASTDTWNKSTWSSWVNNNNVTHTVDGVTISTDNALAYRYQYGNDELMMRNNPNGTITFASDGANFTRIEMTHVSTNPTIEPTDGWTISGNSAVWEGNTDSLVITKCTIRVSQIVFIRENPAIASTDVDGQYNVIPGAEVKVVATAQDGNYLSEWSNGAAVTNRISDTLALTVNETMTLSASFAQNPTLTLASEGNGTVAIEGVIPFDTVYANVLTTQALFNQMTVVDNNTHNNKYGTWTFSTSSVDPSAVYTFHNQPGDDWLITPAFEVEAGTTYTISFDAKRASANNELFEVKAASANTAAALSAGSVVVGNTNPQRQYSHYTGTFTPTEDGTYYVGIHAISDANKNGIYVKNLNITRAVTIPGVVTTAQANTFRVLPGTELTVKATPAAVHYVASWSNDAAVDNRLGAKQTFTMPAENTTLSASFAQNPTLTLASNNGGEFEVVLPSYEPKIFTADAPASGTRSNDTVQVTLEGQLEYSSTFGWQALYQDQSQGSITVTAANGFTIESCKFNFRNGSYTVTEAPFTLYTYCQGSLYTIRDQPNGQGNSLTSGGVVSIEVFYKAVPNVIAAATPNTYYINYGSDVTVIATPDNVHYLANFDGTDVRNDSDTATKVYTNITSNTTLTANFATIPTLTLAANDTTMGSVELQLIGKDSTLYSNALNTQALFNEMTVVDKNGSTGIKGTWIFDGGLGDNATRYFYHETLPGDDWLITPNSYYLEPGTYKVSLQAKTGSKSERFEVRAVACTTATAAVFSAGKQVIDTTSFQNMNWSEFSGTFTVTSGDNYLVGIHAISNPNNTNLVVRNFSIKAVPILPDGVTQLTDSTYRVLPGSALTVNATPDSVHYFVNWNEEAALNSNSAVSRSLTMPAESTTLTANFEQKPTITLVSNGNEKGNVVVAFADEVESMTIGKTGNLYTGTHFKLDYVLHPNANYGMPGFHIRSGNNATVTALDGKVIHKIVVSDISGSIYNTFTTSSAGTIQTAAGDNVITINDINATQVVISNTHSTGVLCKNIDIYYEGSTLPAGVTQLTDSTYLVDYGTQVTATATANDGYHMVSWSNGAAVTDLLVNSDTVTVTTDSTIRANFIANPTLTLASNDTTWGSVAIEGVIPFDSVYANALTTEELFNQMTVVDNNGHNSEYGTWTFYNSEYNPAANYTYNSTLPGDDWLITPAIEVIAGTTYTISFDASRISHKNELIEVKAASANTAAALSAGSVVVEPTNPQSSSTRYTGTFTPTEDGNYYVGIHAISDANSSGMYVKNLNITRSVTIPGVVTTENANAYRVLPGTEVKVNATAANLRHIESWQNEDMEAYPANTILDSHYFVGQQFPGNSTLTLTMGYGDTTANVTFGRNGYLLTFAHNDGGHMEFVVNYDSIAFNGISTTSVTGGDITITADQADEDGMYLRNETGNINIAIEGGASITQVDFHITNGSNLVNTIGVDAEGATITTTNNNQYGSIKGLGTSSLTISSSTTHDLQIDQFTVHYGSVLPANVVSAASDTSFYVLPDSSVVVRAVPADGHYLVSWSDNIDTVIDALSVSITMSHDDTLTATFAPNPVLTLAVSDETMGSAYFTGYHGNTVTRAGIIKAQSIDLPYRWYEASEIMNIIGSGMVTKDATSHYLIVNDIFEGIDTVITSTGAFTVTCEPTLPNGVHYNIADDNYTVNPSTTLSLTATPNPNYYFVDWAKVTATDSTIFDSVAVTTVTIDGDMKLQANFLHNPYTLTLVADANMGTLDTVPGQQYVTRNDNGTYTVMTDSTVTLVAAANTGYHITGWQNAQGNQANLTNDTVRITIVSDTTIAVTLAGNPVVTLADNSNGTVIIDSLPEFAVDNQNGTYSVLPGTVLNIIATPDVYYYMTRWSDVDTMVNSNVAVVRTDTINADTTIGASFAHKPILTLTVNDTNSGSVTLEGAGSSSGSGSGEPVDVTIGYGTNTTYITPYQSLWGYSFVESLYTAEEIGTAGTITSISYNMQSTDPQTNNFVIYMKNVSRSTFASTTDYEPVTDADIVYSGTVTFNPGWTTITLGTPFEYDGTSNLMIAFDENTNGYSTRYFYFTENANKVVSYHNDNHNPDPYNLGSFAGSTYVSPNRANIKLDITPSTGMAAGVAQLTDSTYVVDYNNDVIMKANAKTGYNFLRWEDANGQVYGTDSVLTISPMVTDTLVHAVFDTLHYNLVVNIAEGDEDFGTVEGSVADARHFLDYTIVATPDSGYHLAGWYAGDSPATIVGTTDTMVVTLHSDSTFTATFDTNTYNLHVVVADTCEGFGTVEGDTIAKHFKSYAISATANPGYHFVAWSDGDSNAARTVELTSDSTIEAIFDYNPSLTIEYDGQNGHVEFIVETQTATFTGIQTASLSDGGVSVSAESADGSGMSMKNGKRITIATDGSSVITQVAFHLTNGTNKASTIVANAGMVNTTNGDAYGAVTDVRRDSVIISSTSDKDINIDQLTIQYRRELPVGVVHLEGSPANVYHVERDTTVRLLAVPADSNYLEYWAGDTTSTTGLTAVVAVADEDVTVEAKFSGNPLLTLKAVGEGRVYFEGYSGYTINRNEEIKATNQTEFPYTWYEVGTINEITGGDSMVTKDNTEHYISVHGAFNGTATVVTTSGSFNVTCIPTVPNGVTVMALDTFSVEPGTVLTVNAVTDEEHYLLNWDDLDSAAAERTVTVNSNTSLVAHFLHNPYNLTLESDTVRGTVAPAEGQAFVTLNEDSTYYIVMADSTVTVVATAQTGYHLSGWSHSDTLANTVEITMVQDSLVSVTFDTNTYGIEIAVAEECDGMGSVSTTPDSLNHFLSTTCIATASEGYHFTGWQNEAGTVVEENDTLELSPVSDTALYATFDTNAYRVDVLVAVASNGMGEVEAEPDTVLHFLSARYAATPAEGYRFMGWQNEAGTVVEENDTIEIAAISDTVVYAVFDTSVYLLVVHAADSSMGSVAGTDSAAKHFVEYTVSATAEPGFHFVSWNDGETVNPRTVSPTKDTAFTAVFDTTHAELAWSADTFTCYTMIDANNWRPTLDNPNNVEVRYGCVEGTVPVVDTTGVIGSEMNPGHIIGATGVYHIYAVHATTNDFFYDSVVYVLNVEQGVTVILSKNIDDGGTARFTDQDSLPTLTHVYGTSTMAFVAHGDSVTVEATPATGYNFSAWQTGSDNDGWNNLSTASEYSFIIPEDTSLAALRAAFDTIVYGVTVAVADDCEGFGSVNTTPASVKHFLSGRYIATPAEGYIFTGWQNEAGTVVEDNDTIDIWPVSDTAVYATFDTNTHHLAVAVADTCEGFGTVEGDTVGKHFLDYEIEAMPATCYHFVKWSDGVTDNPRTVELTSDSTIYAQFAYTVRKGYDTIEICDTAEWNDSIYTVSGDYSKMLGTTEHCDSTAMLHLTIKNSTFSVEDTTVCESYTWNNVDYFTTTVAFYYTKNAVGCDSTAQLNLTVNNATESRETVVTCDSVYKWNGFTYTTSTLGIYHTLNQYGCDSTATLDLTLNHNFTGVDEQQHCESYTWVNGVTYNESTDTPTYVYPKLASNGCDSTVTLHLTISNTINVTEDVTACDSYEWHDSVYTSSTSEPSYTSSSVAGCDSIVTLNLTINNSVDTSFNAATCSYYIWDGTYYNETGSYTKHYTGTNNCDSTVTMNLSVNTFVHTYVSETACGSYIWNDIEYTASGAYTQSFTGTNNCDSTVTLTLTVKQPVAATVAVIAGSSYEWNGTTYTQSGNYTYTTTGSNGCDSVTTLQLTLNDAVNGSMTMTACNSYTWNGQTYSESGDYTYSHLDNYGNTQVDTLHLTINSSVTSQFDMAACNSYVWDGTFYNQSGNYTKHYTAVNGCDSAATMNLTVKQPVYSTETVEACDEYLWHDSLYTSSTSTTSYTSTAANGCDSVTTLHLTVNRSSATTETVVACVEYLWNDSLYTSSTSSASYTSKGINNCDSTVTLNLTINQPVYSTETVEACDEYLWHDSLYTSSTSTTSYTSTGVNGCDSTVTLNLTISNSVESSFAESACNYYIWDGTFYNESGSFTKHYTAANGCDSASTMNLTINHPVTTDTSVSSCGSYAWNGVSYNASGAYQRKFTGSNGCDSTVNLTLTVKQAVYTTETVTACDEYLWHDSLYTSSTSTTSYTSTGVNGCDSTVTLNLTVKHSSTGVETLTACDSLLWHGTMYTASTNEPTYQTVNLAGCDSTVTLNLTVKNSVQTSFDSAICGFCIWNGSYYDRSGSYTKHYTAVNGCDSASTMNLTVKQGVTVTLNETACGSYTWNGTEYNASGAYQQKFTAGNGCDSTVNLTLTVKQPTAATVVASACDSYEWHGTTYTETPAVAPTYTTTGSNGCDSVTTLQLVVAHSGSSVDVVTACDSYTWINGVTYTESTNTPTHTITGSGCNTTVTLNLTIKNSVQTSFDNSACDSYTWDGTYYNETGSYTKHYTAVNGCDSAATMNLTVNHPVYTTETVTACDLYEWNGNTYTSSTSTPSTTKYTTTGSNNCDSTVTLNLTINRSSATTETVVACVEYLWNDSLYTSSTSSASYTSKGINGCDSLVTLNLTVNQPVSTTETVVACGEYEWHGTTYTASTNTPTYQTTGVNGCDSTVTLNLTVKESIETSFDTAACIYCIWDGAYYDRSGSYTKHYTALNGCDSASTMNLTVNNPTSTTETVTACGSYFWNSIEYTVSGAYQQGFVGSNGCDSTVTLTLTIKQPVFTTETVAACESLLWNGEWRTESGEYSYTTEGSNGCDSTVTLNLTVKNSVYTTETVVACDEYEWHGTTYTSSTSTPSYTSTGSNGCDSTVTLNLTVKNSVFTTETETVCDSYDWNGELRTATGEYSYTTTAANGCDSTVTLTLTVNRSSATTETVVACVEYLWHDSLYTSSTSSASYTSKGINGCDSTVTLNLTVNQPVFTSETATACDEYLWNGEWRTESGEYDYTTTGVNGCDSTVTLTLTIKNSVQTSFDTAACEYYIWDGTFHNQSGSYTKHYTALNGCDSTVTMNLTVNQPVTASVSETACGGYTWNGIEYTASGAYTRIFTGNNGCDSTVTLTLTVKQPVYTTETVVACDEYLWHDSLYTSSTSTTSYTSTGSNGCDSTVTLNLTVKHSTTGVETVEACDSYEWHGVTYYASNSSATYTTTNVAGCDSTVTLNLTIKSSTTGIDNVTACESYTWNGTEYGASGSYQYTTTAANGCDSVVTLNLTLNQPVYTTENITACGEYEWHGTTYTASTTTPTFTTTGVNGCDSTVTLNLTVNQPVYTTETVTACGEYLWNGELRTESGEYEYTTTGVNGCDSTVTLNLTVSQPVFTSEDVEACGSYEWNGTVYTASGSYTFTTTSVAGCDSTATLNLTVNNPVHTSETAVACGSHAWNGTVYTESGDYTYSHLDANGCTQVDTLHLTIGSSVYTEETVTTCDSYEWNGRVYTESGDYTYSTTTVTGCDSTVTLHLTVNHSAQTSFDTLCYGTFVWNGETFSESGTYERTLTTVTGCDSVVTVNLVILPEGFVMPYLYNLMDVMLTINHNEEGMEEVRYVWYRWYRNGEMVLEGPDKDSYSEGGSKLNGCYYLEVAVDESMEYWVRSNEVCINAVGIDDVKELSFTLAPNPAMHNETVTVSVEAGSADLQGSEIRVYDVQGRIVLTVENTDRFEAPLATGMYMVRLTLADGRSVVKRLIVK